MTKVLRDPWEAAVGGVACVVVDDSVLDQLLRGCPQVYDEILALQDQDVLVETTAPLVNDTVADLAVLRQAARDGCELAAQNRLNLIGGAIANRLTRSTALWSLEGTASDRARRAEVAGFDLYEPQILIRPRDKVLTARQALQLAQGVRAISTTSAVPLTNAAAQLVGLR